VPDYLVLKVSREVGVEPTLPASLVVQVMALACEFPRRLSLRPRSLTGISHRNSERENLVKTVTPTTNVAVIYRSISTCAKRAKKVPYFLALFGNSSVLLG
jgi:hypothetical protein